MLLCGLRFTHELLHKDMSWSCHVGPEELTERVREKPQLSATDSKETNTASSEAKESLKNETVSAVASRCIVSAKRLFQSPNLSSIEPPEKPAVSSGRQHRRKQDSCPSTIDHATAVCCPQDTMPGNHDQRRGRGRGSLKGEQYSPTIDTIYGRAACDLRLYMAAAVAVHPQPSSFVFDS